jgi:hypothetical protein
MTGAFTFLENFLSYTAFFGYKNGRIGPQKGLIFHSFPLFSNRYYGPTPAFKKPVDSLIFRRL